MNIFGRVHKVTVIGSECVVRYVILVHLKQNRFYEPEERDEAIRILTSVHHFARSAHETGPTI